MSEHDCDATKRRVHEYLQGELDEQEMKIVDQHLAHCEECEDEFDVHVALSEAIEKAYKEDAEDEFTQRVLYKLRKLGGT